MPLWSAVYYFGTFMSIVPGNSSCMPIFTQVGVAVPVRVSSYNQIERFNHLQRILIICNLKPLEQCASCLYLIRILD